MNNIYIFILFLITFVITGCSSKEDVNPFFKKEPQETSHRVIHSDLSMLDSLSLYDLHGMNNPGLLNSDSDYLYVLDYSPHRLYIFEKPNFNVTQTITPETGRGPGEIMGIQSFSVNKNHIILADHSQHKILLWDFNGQFINEFITEQASPYRINIWDDDEFIINSPTTSTESLFHKYDVNGNYLLSFGEVSRKDFNPFMYAGQTTIDNEYYYFAGYSEHIIQKWDREGNQVFSVTTIDDYPFDANYIIHMGEQTRFEYAPDGIFSAMSIHVFNNYILLIHGDDRYATERLNPYVQYLDIYDSNTGRYVATWKLPYMASNITADEDYLYILHQGDNDIYIGVYANKLYQLEEVGEF